MFLIGLLYLYQIIGGSEFWKYEGIDEVTDLSLNKLGTSIKSIPINFNKMSSVISLRNNKWTKNMLRITSSQKCSVIHLMISFVKPISFCIHNT